MQKNFDFLAGLLGLETRSEFVSNTYCFSTVIMVTWRLLIIMLHVLCICCRGYHYRKCLSASFEKSARNFPKPDLAQIGLWLSDFIFTALLKYRCSYSSLPMKCSGVRVWRFWQLCRWWRQLFGILCGQRVNSYGSSESCRNVGKYLLFYTA